MTLFDESPSGRERLLCLEESLSERGSSTERAVERARASLHNRWTVGLWIGQCAKAALMLEATDWWVILGGIFGGFVNSVYMLIGSVAEVRAL